MSVEMSSAASGPTSAHPDLELHTPTGVSWRSVALPSEHGGWSLTAEPAVLALLVAWSWPGLALGIAAMVAFVARTPIKLVLVDTWRHRRLDRTRLAMRIGAIELAALSVLVVVATWSADSGFWLPLACAAPLISVELWYDMRSRGRRLVPELAGAVGIGSVATAIALTGGASARVGWGLWAVVAARSVGAIPYVRVQILRTRLRPGHDRHSDVAQLLSSAVATSAWMADLIPIAPCIAIGAIGAFNVVAVRAAPRPAMVIGVQQMIFGIALVAITATALHLS